MIALTSKDPARLPVDALVVATAPADGAVALVGADWLPAELRTALVRDAKALGVTGKADEVRRVPATGLKAKVLVLTGLGTGAVDAETLRRAAGAATRELAGVGSVALALPVPDAAAAVAVAEGALLGAYSYARYHAADAPVASIEVVAPKAKDAAAGLARAQVLAAAVHATRDLVNAAPNHLYPEAFADAAHAAAKGVKGVKLEVRDEKALAAGGYGGLIGVGQGSTRPPRLVKVSYAPSRRAKATVALVGKGITFDSGGISIKPSNAMETMKSDMAGAAAVLHTVLAAAKLGLPVAVTGWLCLAENMPSGSAQRPSDVITIRGGKTVEVLNTDAEGRLVMADGLVAATEEKPDVVIDIATLTGAQIVALGDRVAGVMGSDEVREQVLAAAAASGEQAWGMPLPDELKAGLSSKVADLANVAADRAGGMLTAGVFLREFAGETPWAHIDIAGPSFNERAEHGYTPRGGTGYGVRTLLAFVESRVS